VIAVKFNSDDERRRKIIEKQGLDIGTFFIDASVLKWLFKFKVYGWIEDPEVLSGAEKVFKVREGRYVPYNLVRDVYRFLSGRVGKIRISPANYWVYDIIIRNPEFRELCQLTEGRDVVAKITMQMVVAKLIQEGVVKQMKSLPMPMFQQEKLEQELQLQLQSQPQQGESNQEQSGSEESIGDRGEEVFDEENEGMSEESESSDEEGEGMTQDTDTSTGGNVAPSTSEVTAFIPLVDEVTREKTKTMSAEVSRICASIKDIVREDLASLRGGLFGGIRMTRQAEIIKIDIPRECLKRINKVVRNVYGEYLTDEWVSVKSSVPEPTNPELLEEDLASLKVLEAGFLGRERKSKMKLDIYLDASGSMGSYFCYKRFQLLRFDVALSILKSLLSIGVKINKLFLFNTAVWEEGLEDAIEYNPEGGTRFLKVAEKIRERKRPSLVISDMEANENNDAISERERRWLKFVKPNSYYIGIIADRGAFPGWVRNYFKCVYEIETK